MDNLIRKYTRQAYDVQKLRIATGLRVVTQFKSRFEQTKDLESEDKDAQDKAREKVLKLILDSYERVTDGVVATARKKEYKFDSILRDEADVWFIENYTGMLNEEQASFKRLRLVLETDSFYNSWLSKVKGVGPAMAGVIMSELDPHKAKYPSHFWKYAGLDVVAVFDKETNELVKTEGRGRYQHHLVEKTATSKSGEVTTFMGLSYNPWLKSKLLAVLGPSFLRAGNEKYVKLYQDYKFRMLNRPDIKDQKNVKILSHRRAMRYCVKQFLVDLHMAWREHEGLEVHDQYGNTKLGLKHGQDPSVYVAQ